MSKIFDAIVIGAGEAGAIVADLALGAGKRVALIYKEPYGSTCLNTGCVPSKFMIHRARIAHLVRTAERFHIAAAVPQIDLSGIVREKNQTVESHRHESFQAANTEKRLTLIAGEAQFVSAREIVVGGRRLRSDRIFIATGMRPHMPRLDGADRISVLTNETLMELTTIPEHLIIAGGGYIACEMGQAFRRYGSRVTIIQTADHLVPREEPDVSTLLERAFEAEGIDVLLGYRVVSVEPVPAGIRARAQASDGRRRQIDGTHFLAASGRRPNTDTLHLDAAGIDVDEKGFIKVDRYLETSAPGVWAIGDVNGQQPFTRVCQEEGKVAYANAFEGARIEMERGFLGHAIFTDPEIGSVGLTEREARQQSLNIAAGLITFDQVEKAELIDETIGLIKYVTDRGTHRLIGCHIIGPSAADLIYDAIVVMRGGGRIDDLATAVGIFPTLQEGVEGAARGLLRRIAPEEVRGPLVAAGHHKFRKEVRSDAAAEGPGPEVPGVWGGISNEREA